MASDPMADLAAISSGMDPTSRAGFGLILSGQAPPPDEEWAQLKQQVDTLPPENRSAVIRSFKPSGPDTPAGKFGQFAGYEQDPSGGTMFRTADGESVLYGGPEADALRARLDANKPQPTAGLTPGRGTELAQTYFGQPGAPPSATDVPAETPGAAPSPTAPAAPLPPGVPEGFRPIGYGDLYVGPDGRTTVKVEQVAGSPGVSREQLEAKVGQGTNLQTGGAKTTSGGYETDPAYQAALKEEVDAARANAIREEARSNAEFAQAQKDLGVAREKETRIAEQLKKSRDQYTAADAEFSKSRVDSRRLFKGEGGALRAIGAAIAAAGGAYAATIGRTENFALDIINKAIDDDIAAQKQDIATKGEAADNAMAQFVRDGMSMERAEEATRSLQAKAAASEAAIVGNSRISRELISRAEAAREKYDREAMGEVVKQEQYSTQYPVAPTRGGTRVRQATIGEAKGAQDIGLAGAPGAAGGKVPSEIVNAQANIAASRQKVLELEKTHERLGGSGVEFGPWGFGKSEEQLEFEAGLNGVTRIAGKALEGDAAAESHIKDLKDGLSSHNGAKVRAALRSLDNLLEIKQRALEEQLSGGVATPPATGQQ